MKDKKGFYGLREHIGCDNYLSHNMQLIVNEISILCEFKKNDNRNNKIRD